MLTTKSPQRPSPEQWLAVAELMQERQLVPYFDSSYQGFVTGNFQEDGYAIRLFEKRGFQFLVSVTYGMNFGLYNERIGSLHVVCANDVGEST